MRFVYAKKGTKRFNNKKKVVVNFRVMAAHCNTVDPKEFGDIRARGVAVCHPDDTFDATYGKRLAETRAKRKLFKKSATILTKAIAKRERELQELKDTLQKQLTFLAKETEHEQQILLHQQG